MLWSRSLNILIAEDDDDHYFLTEKILNASAPHIATHRVHDGEELLELLKQSSSDPVSMLRFPPDLIILDINMPRKDGWDVLRELKSHPQLRHIPVVVLTTSDIDEDKFRGYDLGANSYIRKPIDYKKWVEVIEMINRYWFGTVELPVKGENV